MDSNILNSGWNLSPEGLNIVTENGNLKDRKKILENALNLDLKTIGKPVLSNELSKTRISKTVLQIQKIRNVSAPKAKENSQAAPRMLKLTLTDGETYIQAIELSPINSISRDNTAPGTKVLITDANIVSGYLLISSETCRILGGCVEHLHDKWLLAKSIQQNHQYVSTDGAPPWVAFGCKILTGNEDKSFKSLDKGKDENANSEFDQQRKEAIAEASSGAVRKTFGGRVKQNVQPVQNNNQTIRGKPRIDRDQNERGRKGKFAQKEDESFEKFQKPSEKVSLFSFLEDKLPITESKKDIFYKPPTQDNRPPQNKPYTEKYSNQNSNPSYRGETKYDNTKKTYDQNNGINNFNRKENNMRNESANNRKSNNYSSANKSESYQYNKNKDRSQQQPPQQQNRVQNQSSYNPASTTKPQYYGNAQSPSHTQKPKLSQNVVQNQSNYQHDADMHNIAANLSRISVNNEFASRSLKQHLNLGFSVRKQDGGDQKRPNSFKIGDRCLAKYWEDEKLYNAVVTAVTDKTYAVQFTGYGNIEEVLKSECFPEGGAPKHEFKVQTNSTNNYSGMSAEFRRRGPPRK